MCLCVSVSLSLVILLYMCPHTTVYMQREEEKLRSDTARLELARARLAAASRCAVYLLTGTKVHILTKVQIPRASLLLPGTQFTCFYTTMYVSYICVLKLLCTSVSVSSYSYTYASRRQKVFDGAEFKEGCPEGTPGCRSRFTCFTSTKVQILT